MSQSRSSSSLICAVWRGQEMQCEISRTIREEGRLQLTRVSSAAGVFAAGFGRRFLPCTQYGHRTGSGLRIVCRLQTSRCRYRNSAGSGDAGHLQVRSVKAGSHSRTVQRECDLRPTPLPSSDLFQRPSKSMHIGGRRPCRARVPERRWIRYTKRLAGTIKSSRFLDS
jgi:hypothetical protein